MVGTNGAQTVADMGAHWKTDERGKGFRLKPLTADE